MNSLRSAARGTFEHTKAWAQDAVGGPARLRVILLLGLVLGLDAADKATVSAVAGSLKQAFHIGNTEIGLLIAAVSFTGSLFTLPMGVLVDRTNRKRILVIAIAVWTVAMVASGTATSFVYMIGVRVFLGGVTAAATPAVASLVGDFFPAAARARAYGTILGGELVGLGIGFFVSSEVSAFAEWRWSFYVMGLPSALIGLAIWRFLPEPGRGGQSWIRLGQEEIESPDRGASGAPQDTPAVDAARTGQGDRMHERIARSRIGPRRDLVLRDDPTTWSIWRTLRYVLRIPSYRLLVIASALGYYFFAGVRAFAMIYITGHYGLSRGLTGGLVLGVVGLGALAGVIAGGRLATRLLDRGWISARIVVPGGALLLATLLLAPAIWIRNPFAGITLLTLGACALAAANPPIDAARLDIVHPRLWGRAESGRMALRGALEGAAPLLFGWMSGWIAPGNAGLQWTFLIMLITLVAASALAIPARRAYPRDVATADASFRAVPADGRNGGQ